MSERSVLKQALGSLAVVVVLLLVLGQLLGQPILLGYVATGSMEPTMAAGDGFVAIPSVVAGEVEEGDVVVFDARELHDGGLTTHRVVDETDEGYVTAGDANPFTDQDGGEPPVTDGRIVAVALQVNGEVVTVPHLGTVVMGVHGVLEGGYDALASTLGLTTTLERDGLGSLLVGLGVALLGFGVLLDRFGPAKREARRSTSRENVLAVRVVLAVILVVFVTFGTAAMVLPSGVVEYGVVSTDDPTDDPQVLAPGETGTLIHTVDNAGLVPVVTVLEPASSGVEVEPERLTVGSRGDAEAAVTLHAPDEPGEYTRDVAEHRYLLVAPPSVLAALHGIHPLVAIAAVNGVVVGVVVGGVLVLFGSGELRLRSAGDHVPVVTRLRRKLRKWR
ncbi:signal peptidase I [Natrialbaceae archaeon AArc-T1-2]|uniref:signal peptidase I n=1 Tax=Natrialbaceae archaeon AArc-T1-2 TaxID=3053904 RepID=UPI00255B1514|nr:signal peptidase I [Natrialbaceae archaeon AArc-T1-2]WIV65759.1 signal peptidase I [Natrialbaceae archaeon AArc-T1-2]